MEQARHAASTKRHSRHELQNRRKRKPVFLRMMGVLLVAGAALACFGFWRFQTPGIVLGPFEDEPSTAESVPPPEPEPQPVTTTLRFSATGDNLIHAPIYKQAARRAAEGQRYDFDYCYEHLLDFYAAQDVNWINQETLCSKELEPSTYPCFSTPGECAEALYRAGIRVFSLSNNHTYDKGAKGIAATLRFWDEMPEDVVTTGLWYGESDYGTIPLQTVNGVTIAYLSYTDHTNGIPQSSAMTANVIYTSQRDVMEQQVRRARELADFVVFPFQSEQNGIPAYPIYNQSTHQSVQCIQPYQLMHLTRLCSPDSPYSNAPQYRPADWQSSWYNHQQEYPDKVH